VANQKHLAILKQGVEVWNEWRLENPNVEVNLNGANFEKQDLRGANLTQADLSKANLYRTYLRKANLRDANLADANLKRVQALSSNFEGAILTGACIEDWHINSQTNLNNVICDYIYLKDHHQERRPHDPNKNFAPGEFTKLFQKTLETVDLIFREGVDG
jgi:uncharacterized protein YjbI with pentapeptide repeats